jgi:fibronectin-binding autotransporter adhesin
MILRSVRALIACAAATTVAAVSHAQTITQSFQTSTTPNWTLSTQLNGTFSPLSGVMQDASGNKWLELVNNTGNQATVAQYNGNFSSAGASVYAQFSYQMYGGTGGTTTNHGGDGLTFFFYDGSLASSTGFATGAYGGSMGYAQKTGINGLTGGYIGVGLDAYGNYSAASEGRRGGLNNTTQPVTQSVAVRGPGSGTSGYAYLGGTSAHLGTGDVTVNVDSTTRPTTTNTVQVLLSATNQLTVTLSQGGATPQTVLQMDLSGYSRPDLLSFGFTAGTGAATDFILVNNLTVTTLTASRWTNSTGNGNWALNTNWNPTIVPTNGSDILFDNSTVSTAQTIDTGASRTVRSLTFDAPFNYTVNNNTFTFDSGGVSGFSGIAATQTHGTAVQTINSNLSLNNAITIRNGTTGALTINGTIATNGKSVTIDGTGTSTLTGVISGTGSIVKNDTGMAAISGANTYTGGTTINNGTVNANNATALGSGGVTLAGGTLGSTNSATIANPIAVTADSGLADITSTGNLTLVGANRTLTLDNTNQSGAVKLSDTTTGHTLTIQVDNTVTSSNISGSISNGSVGATAGNLTKTGAGTLILAGNNTYTGATTITAGSILLGASDRLAQGSSMSIGAAGTLNLGGFSQKISGLAAEGGGTLDFGTPGTSNNFVFGTYTAPTSGVLVVNNFETGDKLATTVANQTVSTIYISGQGTATEATGTSTVGSYGSAYLITPIVTTAITWDGSSSALWNTGANWSPASVKPGTTQIALFNDTGAARTSVTLDVANTIAGLRFAGSTGYTISSIGRTLTLSGAVPYIQQQSSANQTLALSGLSLTASTVIDVTGSGNLTISGPITSTTNLIKDGTGAGKLILSGNNASTFTGDIYVNNGVLQAANSGALGSTASSTTIIAAGAGLELTGNVTIPNAISVTGSGLSSAGALHNVAGANTISGTVTTTGATTITADTGSSFTLGTLTGAGNDVTFGGAGNITAGAVTTGAGAVNINSTGNVTFNGTTANTYTGTTTVNSGTLVLAKSASTDAIAGNLVINGGAVQLGANFQIDNSATVTVNGSGKLDVNGNTETLRQLTSTSSTAAVTLGTGTLNLNSPSNANTNYAGTITGAAGSNFNVVGAGKVSLSGDNSGFVGTINVNSGTLHVSGSNNAAGAGTVNVATGGNLQVQGGVTVATPMTINGTGTSGNGAVENFGSNNTLTGNVTLAGAARIQSDSGTLTVAGPVNLGANTLTVGGASDTSITGLISGTAGLNKDGVGTLHLGHTGNTFSGPTTITAGTLVTDASNVFNSTSAVTVTSGQLSLLNTSQTIATLSGAGNVDFGTAGTGKLTLSGGSSSFAGTFSGTGSLVINSGATLTLNGSFADANLNITLNGGTLILNGASYSFGTLTVSNSSSILDFGSYAGTTTFNVNNVTLSTFTLSVKNWANLNDFFIAQNFVGATTSTPRGTAPLNQVVFQGWTGANTAWQSWDHQITPAPEPATYGMIFMTFSAALVGLRRFRLAQRARETGGK